MNYCKENKSFINDNKRIYTKDNEYFVYKHTSPNNKVYIGITRQNPPNKRWANGKGYEYNTYFSRAIKKYGWDKFNHEILFKGLTVKEAEEKERELIALYNSADSNFGYNIDLGGRGAGRVSNATKERISNSHIGINAVPVVQYSMNGDIIKEYYGVMEAARQNNLCYEAISASCRGIAKTSGGFIWRYKSDKITEDYVKWCNTNEYLENIKTPIKQYSMSGELIAEYESAEWVKKQLSYSGCSIRLCCKGILKSYKGYIWRFANDILTDDYIQWCNTKNNATPVVQYTINGEYVNQFKSITSASKTVGIDVSNISHCCRGECKTAGGFIWKYKGDKLLSEQIEWCQNKYINNRIIQYALNGEVVNVWKNPKEAAKLLECNVSCIRDCCKRKNKTAYGYIWRFANEPLTEDELQRCITKKKVVDKKPNITLMKPVCQYTKEGRFIEKFSSLFEIKERLNYDDTAISRCCRKIQRLSYGYIWRYEKDLLTKEDLIWCNDTGKDSMKKLVYQYSLSGELIRKYKSVADVKRELGYDVGSISSCCLGKSKTAYGYLWRYEKIKDGNVNDG